MVRIEGRERIAAALPAVPSFMRFELRKTLSKAGGVIRDDAARRLHSPGGRARRGLRVRIKGTGIDMSARIGRGGPQARAASFSMTGRGPGKMPPISVVEAWVRKSGQVRGVVDVGSRRRVATIRASRKVRSAERDVAFLIASRIARRGIAGRPVMQQARQATHSRVVALFEDLLRRTAQRLESR